MFDKKSDYALNKCEKDAIVYITVTGVPMLLTRVDFASEDEFLRWKAWSNNDYQNTEQDVRSFYDNCISFDERLDCIGAVPSIENEFFGRFAETEYIQNRTALMEQIRNALTEKQYRRLWLYYVEGMTEEIIAKIEGVTQQRISMSIISSTKKIKKRLKNFL